MIKIIAFDPGITTGYAQGFIATDVENAPMLITTGQAKWDHLELLEFCVNYIPNIIVCENFLARHTRYRQGVELFSRELIGVLKVYCASNKCELVLQNPMKGNKSAKFKNVNSSYFSDEKLKKDALFKSGKGHANDAVRHLLYWYWFSGGGRFKSRQRGYKTGVMQ